MTESRQTKIEQLREYIEKFYSGNPIPPRPDGLSNKTYQIICRLYLLANEFPDGEKVRIYLGDLCEDAYDLKISTTQAIQKLNEWRNVPCLFAQTAILSYTQYNVKFTIGYDATREYLDRQTCLILKRQQVDNRQRRFF